jgi:hypothetical protein
MDKKQARKALAATMPQRDQYETQDEFEEAMSYWQQRQGKSLALTSRSPVRPKV